MLLANKLHGARAWRFQPANDVQQGRLTTARRADDAEEFPIAYLEINPADSAKVASISCVYFGQASNDDFHLQIRLSFRVWRLVFNAKTLDARLQTIIPKNPPALPLPLPSASPAQSRRAAPASARRLWWHRSASSSRCADGNPYERLYPAAARRLDRRCGTKYRG